MTNDVLTSMGISFLTILNIFAYVLLAKWFRDWCTKDLDDDFEICVQNNNAVSIRRAGLYFGILIAFLPLLAGKSAGIAEDFKLLNIEGVQVFVAMMIARFINDRFMLWSINNNEAVKNKNAAVGIAEAGSYIATGLLLKGCFSGKGTGDLLNDAFITWAFIGVGQLCFISLFWVYEAYTSLRVFNKEKAFGVVEMIKKGNLSAAIEMALLQVSVSNILSASITGDSLGFVKDLSSCGTWAVFGIVSIIIARIIADKIFLPKTTVAEEISQDNVGGVLLSSTILCGFSFVISMIILN